MAQIVREEMDRIGAQEIRMPVVQPAELWQQTGRWSQIGGEMARLKDRAERDRLFKEMCKIWPSYADYEKKTDRLIPVALLERIQ